MVVCVLKFQMNKATRELTSAIDLTCADVHFRLENFDAWSEKELCL